MYDGKKRRERKKTDRNKGRKNRTTQGTVTACRFGYSLKKTKLLVRRDHEKEEGAAVGRYQTGNAERHLWKIEHQKGVRGRN